MSSGFLSQEEINSLLSGESIGAAEEETLTQEEKELIGEVGRASMESAASTLAMITSQPVNITTPVVNITTLADFKNSIELPYMSLEVKYISGVDGRNLLVNKIKDAQIIANLMMGGDGQVADGELSEIEESAVSEAMNQMIGSAATSMANLLSRTVNITPPISGVWKDTSQIQLEGIDDNENIVKVSYKMTIGSFVDSSLIQILPIKTAKNIAEIMQSKNKKPQEKPDSAPVKQAPAPAMEPSYEKSGMDSGYRSNYEAERAPQPVEVHQASFQPLKDSGSKPMPKNIDLILDVPLEISVVLGRTKKSIKDILNLGTGSLIELDKLAEEPVEILVNGKQVAYGEVVVVGENFGVRITNIVSNVERLKSFGR